MNIREGAPRHEMQNKGDASLPREAKKAKISGFEYRSDASPSRIQLQEDVHEVFKSALAGGVGGSKDMRVKDVIRRAAKEDLSKQDAEHVLSTMGAYFKAANLENKTVDLRDVQADLEKLRNIQSGEQARPEIKQESREYKPTEKAVQDVQDFLNFAETGTIERLEATGLSTDDAIYEEFYSTDGPGRFKDEKDPTFISLKQNYDAQIGQLDGWVSNMQSWLEKNHNILGMIPSNEMRKKGWMYLKGNGGFDHGKPIGRAYLNVKPESSPQVFAQLFEKLRTSGINFEMKLPLSGSVQDFNRVDQIVIYFNDKGEKELLQALKESHTEHSGSFEKPTPRFTSSIQDDNGHEMSGIAFGEQPINSHESFGDVRAKILASLYNQARAEGMSMRDPRFKLAERFQKACFEKQVNAENPAFNIAAKSGNFEAIRSASK